MVTTSVSSKIEMRVAPLDHASAGAMIPIRGPNDYRRAVRSAEHASRAAILRLFRFAPCQDDEFSRDPPLLEFVSRHVQNFIWTHQRFFAKLNHGGGTTAPARPAAAPRDAHAPNLFIDMTGTSRFYSFGGIARVANKISDEAIRSGLAVPVVIDDGTLIRAKSDVKQPVTVKADDIYVIIDTFWYPIEEYKAVIATLKAAGVFVVTFVHDVIPAEHPSFMGSGFPRYFTRCLFEVVERSDLVLSISKAAAADIRRFLAQHDPRLAGKPISTIRLGSDSVLRTSGSIRRGFASTFAEGPTFMTVGTICPHKGQLLALTAFDHLWRQGLDLRLVLIGKAEPAFRGIARAIKRHPEFGKSLFWFDDASDAELAFAYRRASCLIQPSIAEGFGVPIVEAQAAGLPVLASDIPVFHEIGGDEIAYFDYCDSLHLAEMVAQSTALPRTIPKASMRTWKDALDDIVLTVSGLRRRDMIRD